MASGLSSDDQFLQGKFGDFAADGVETGDEDGIGAVVDDDFHARERFERADIAAFTPDDTTLNLVIFNVEHAHRILDGRFRSRALDGFKHNLLCCLGCAQFGLFGHFLHIDHRVGLSLFLDEFDELLLGILRREAGDGFQFLRFFVVNAIEVGFFLVEGVELAFQFLLCSLQFLGLALRLFHLLVGVLLQLVDAVFGRGQFALALVAGLFVFVLHLEEFLLGLQDAFFLDDFGLFLGLFKQGCFFFSDRFFQQCGGDKIPDSQAHQKGRNRKNDV